jgi:CheY-like chemotaxis protein
MKSQLFNPFKQAQKKAGGTGLGLYALSNRVTALKGEYGVRGRQDGKQGSLFWFSFPYVADPMTAAMEAYASTPRLSSPVTKMDISLRVLLVDDSYSILKITKRLLEKKSHIVTTAENGVEALEHLSNGEFDVMLIDVNMPVMDGLETIRRYRLKEKQGIVTSKLRRHILQNPAKSPSSIDRPSDIELSLSNIQTVACPSRCIIVVCSAGDDEADAYSVGADYFIEKPFTMKTFQERVINYRNC